MVSFIVDAALVAKLVHVWLMSKLRCNNERRHLGTSAIHNPINYCAG